MSAGSGVIHSEMPTIDTTGLHGFQCWFNLPAKDKMSPPRYRDLSRDALPIIGVAGAQLTALQVTGSYSENSVWAANRVGADCPDG